MSQIALYDVHYVYKDLHKHVLNLADDLTDEQLNWKPEGYSTSIGFHLWHLARESDYLRAKSVEVFQLGPEFGDDQEIWHTDNLAEKWNFPAALRETVGTGVSDEDAANLPLPSKAELLDYLRRSYEAAEQFVALFDEKYPTIEGLDEAMHKKVNTIRMNFLVFLAHDGRHLGMMECLKGLLTGFGSATEKRK